MFLSSTPRIIRGGIERRRLVLVYSWHVANSEAYNAAGLGNTSPRPSPSEERPSDGPPPLYGSAGSANTTTTPSMANMLASTTSTGTTLLSVTRKSYGNCDNGSWRI